MKISNRWLKLGGYFLFFFLLVEGRELGHRKPPSLRSPGPNDRLECWLSEDVATQLACESLGCLWDDQVDDAAPYCFFPKAGYGYNIVEEKQTPNGFSVNLQRLKSKPRFGADVQDITFEAFYLSENIFRFKFYDPAEARYEVPVQESFDLPKTRKPFQQSQSQYKVHYDNDETYGFTFQVIRKSSNIAIFNTEIGGLTFSDQFLQLASYLPTENFYGIGENEHPDFKRNMTYKTLPLFSRDSGTSNDYNNAYGVHPFYTCLESDGKSHGVFFLNSNAMEWTLMPAPAVSVRTIGGVLDFFIFLGDNPEHVVQLYTGLVGRPTMPPFWSLGFQLCRYGYKNLDEIKAVVNRTREAHIPLDVQYSDIDYMDGRRDFTLDKVNFKGMDQYINETKEDGLRWILILDPAIQAHDLSYQPFVDGLENDVFVHWPNDIPVSRRGNPPGVDTSRGFIYGQVWPDGPSAFPDFFRSSTRDWWKRSIKNFFQDLRVDGLWIDMNEPSNFNTNDPSFSWEFHNCDTYQHNQSDFMKPHYPCFDPADNWHLMCPLNKYDDPLYKPLAARVWGDSVRLSGSTLCMASVHGDQGQYRHYDVHSLYGLSEMEPTISALRDLTGERSLVFSRSTYPSAGRHGGHWLGDTTSIWEDMHRSIIGIMEFSLFGVPYAGSDICGFGGSTTKEMCLRWMQLGAFYPLARNHNALGSPDQDPAALGPEVIAASVRALNTRYSMLPYLYTLFYQAHVYGNTVMRPLFHEFPLDPATYGIDRQFLWGHALLISPVLQQGQQKVVAYIPDDIWYDYYTGLQLTTRGANLTITDLTDIPLHIRGGFVLPSQEPAETTKESRLNPITISVYPKNGRAEGLMFSDDGVSIDTIEKKEYTLLKFSFLENHVTISTETHNLKIQNDLTIKEIHVYGLHHMEKAPKKVLMSYFETTVAIAPENISFNRTVKRLTITLNRKLHTILQPLHITW